LIRCGSKYRPEKSFEWKRNLVGLVLSAGIILENSPPAFIGLDRYVMDDGFVAAEAEFSLSFGKSLVIVDTWWDSVALSVAFRGRWSFWGQS
jgi:hypothetical protein